MGVQAMSQSQGQKGRKVDGDGNDKTPEAAVTGAPPYRKRHPAYYSQSNMPKNGDNNATAQTMNQPNNGSNRIAAKKVTAGSGTKSTKPSSTGPPPRKSKKPPQQLKTISLGDLIRPDALPLVNNSRPQQRKQQQQQQPPQAKISILSATAPPFVAMTAPSTRDLEFPALSTSIGSRQSVPQAALPTATPQVTHDDIAKIASPAAPVPPKAEGIKVSKQSNANNQKRGNAINSPASATSNAKLNLPNNAHSHNQPSANQSGAKVNQPTKGSSQDQSKQSSVQSKLPHRVTLTSDPNVLRANLNSRVTASGQEFMNLLPSSIKPTKGRQRIKPRKKKFTTLKKKVLQERLNKWRAMHPENKVDADVTTNVESSEPHGDNPVKLKDDKLCDSVALYGFVHPDNDQVDDDDEYEELVSNLSDLAAKVGPTKDVFIPRRKERYDELKYPVFIRFVEPRDAAAAISCWNGLVLGGQSLMAIPLKIDLGRAVGGDPEDDWLAILTSNEATDDSNSSCSEPAASKPSRTIIVLENFLTDDDLDDPDCLAETMNDAKTILEPFGKVLDLTVSREKCNWLDATLEGDELAAAACAAQLMKMVVGGSNLVVHVNKSPLSHPHLELRNILSPEDFEDEECLQESLDDIRNLALQFGSIKELKVNQEQCAINIVYNESGMAEHASKHFDGIRIGGSTVVARVVTGSDVTAVDGQPPAVIRLENILTKEDLEDEECLLESLNDIRELASQFGTVVDVTVSHDDDTSKVRVAYEGGDETANQAMLGFNGMLVGGQTIQARILSSSTNTTRSSDAAPEEVDTRDGTERIPTASDEASKNTQAATPQVTQMFSGGKRIPERFAECKRVPKIPNSGTPRHYAKVSNDETIRTLLLEMLEELMRLQRRAVEDKNAKARRRLVMGLREVARGIRAHKVKMVVMANNLDEYGAIDEKLQGILDLAAAEEVPIFFELGKRALGKAVGKTIKVGVVGIQNADGADQQFKKLIGFSKKLDLFSVRAVSQQDTTSGNS